MKVSTENGYGLVVMTLASHARGRGFDPLFPYAFCFFLIFKNVIILTKKIISAHLQMLSVSRQIKFLFYDSKELSNYEGAF